MIARFLPEPDATCRRNRHHPSGLMRLYEGARVERLEATGDWQTARVKARVRSIAAREAAETRLAATTAVQVPVVQVPPYVPLNDMEERQWRNAVVLAAAREADPKLGALFDAAKVAGRGATTARAVLGDYALERGMPKEVEAGLPTNALFRLLALAWALGVAAEMA